MGQRHAGTAKGTGHKRSGTERNSGQQFRHYGMAEKYRGFEGGYTFRYGCIGPSRDNRCRRH